LTGGDRGPILLSIQDEPVSGGLLGQADAGGVAEVTDGPVAAIRYERPRLGVAATRAVTKHELVHGRHDMETAVTVLVGVSDRERQV
jgi:hypothetical protein